MPAYGCAAPGVNRTGSGNASNMIRKAVGIVDHPSFHTSVVTGPALLALSENIRGWRRRENGCENVFVRAGWARRLP